MPEEGMIPLKIGDTIEVDGHEFIAMSFQSMVDFRGARNLQIHCLDPLAAQREIDAVRACEEIQRTQVKVGALLPKMEKALDDDGGGHD